MRNLLTWITEALGFSLFLGMICLYLVAFAP